MSSISVWYPAMDTHKATDAAWFVAGATAAAGGLALYLALNKATRISEGSARVARYGEGTRHPSTLSLRGVAAAGCALAGDFEHASDDAEITACATSSDADGRDNPPEYIGEHISRLGDDE